MATLNTTATTDSSPRTRRAPSARSNAINVSLAFSGRRHFYATVEGEAELIRHKGLFENHRSRDPETWFSRSVDTPGLVLIKVHAKRIKYWDGMKGEGELIVT